MYFKSKIYIEIWLISTLMSHKFKQTTLVDTLIKLVQIGSAKN